MKILEQTMNSPHYGHGSSKDLSNSQTRQLQIDIVFGIYLRPIPPPHTFGREKHVLAALLADLAVL